MNYERKQEAILRSRKRIGNSAWEISLEVERPVSFVPGQYAWVIAPKLAYKDARGNRRPFTIISTPARSHELQFVFREHKSCSGFKRTLIEAPIGSKLEIEAPFGSHVLPADSRPLFLVAGGDGISPYLSMLRDMEERGAWRAVTLIYAVNSAQEAMYREELHGYASTHPELTFIEIEGRITRELLKAETAPDNALWCLSGPCDMTNAVATFLMDAGVDPHRVICEEYPPPVLDRAVKGLAEKMRISPDFYTLVVENAPSHTIFTDVEGTILYCNRAAELLTGYSKEEMLGSTPRLWGGLMAPQFYERLWRTIKEDRKPFTDKIRNRKKSGERYTVIAHIVPVVNKAGKLTGFLGIEQEITNLERLSEERRIIAEKMQAHALELEKANRRLSIEDRAKTEFLATLAHELRNPLAPVVSSLELLKLQAQDLGRPEFIDMLSVAETHTHTLVQLLDDLLDISRVSRKKLRLQKEIVDLRPIVTQALQAVEHVYRARKQTLEVSMPSGEIRIEADPLRLEQVLINLLNNAAKYTGEGGHVTLAISYDDEKGLQMCVTDNGRGIEARSLDKIFEPFLQLHDGSSTGVGIGLSLTKRLVELHGGRVWAKSEGLGKGSSFIVELPPNTQLQFLSPGKRRRKGAPSGEQKPSRFYTILIVDDNELAAEGLGKLLGHAGHSIFIVHDGQSALEKLRDTSVDVVLLDIGMPGMDGYATARALREEHGDSLFIVALTGYGLDDDRERARQAGFDHHLTKPVSIADVESVLAKAGRSPSFG